MKKFDVYHDNKKITGTDSYWIVFLDNDSKLKLGRMGPFNTHAPLFLTRNMDYMGNYGENKTLADLWKNNPAIVV